MDILEVNGEIKAEDALSHLDVDACAFILS